MQHSSHPTRLQAQGSLARSFTGPNVLKKYLGSVPRPRSVEATHHLFVPIDTVCKRYTGITHWHRAGTLGPDMPFAACPGNDLGHVNLKHQLG